jgi:hypothetical protein
MIGFRMVTGESNILVHVERHDVLEGDLARLEELYKSLVYTDR